MQGDVRRVFLAMFVAMVVLVLYQYVYYHYISPKHPPAATQPVAPTTSAPSAEGETPPAVAPGSTTARTTAPSQRTLSIRSAESVGLVTLGGGEKDALRIELHPRGASVSSIELTARNDKGQYIQPASVSGDEPYRVISPVEYAAESYFSFDTHRIWIDELGHGLVLGDVPWTLERSTSESAVFSAVVTDDARGADMLKITKTYALYADKPIFSIDLKVENLSGQPLTIWLEQDGPIGIREEHKQYDMRKLLTAQWKEGYVTLNKGHSWKDLRDKTRSPEGYVELLDPDKGPMAWTCLSNKYFGVYTRPLPVARTDYAEYVADLLGMVAVPQSDHDVGDLLARVRTEKTTLDSGGTGQYVFEVYAGPKDTGYLKKADPAYANKNGLYYQLAQSADSRCCCTFEWLRELMVWLLEKIRFVVRNYGIAIIILVIIIRGALHPLTVFQQKSMFRMQEAMSKIQPKMEAIKEKFANDKAKQNQEMMKMWAEEGVNPLANFVSFLPMLIQMPILIALWTALNTDVNLRLAPFWIIPGHWIRDLSAPDQLFAFTPPIDVPILSDIPLIGSVFRHVAGINILPILMGVSMWLQQKYMPKPHMKAKMEAARQKAEQKGKSGMSPEDQMRQQQMIMYLMAIVFPLMFYKMPAGLNLYWMATNVFGIAESLIIRKQLDREREQKKRLGPAPPKKRGSGPLGRFFKHIAAQAEELQKKADELSQQPPPKSDKRKKKR